MKRFYWYKFNEIIDFYNMPDNEKIFNRNFCTFDPNLKI